ncbi:MAG: hypothetical protein M1833_004561 [Piccolia ochrophora]|nr:MAG: hypothetical protein M1833_004561 [Piccolia ochrophora]
MEEGFRGIAQLENQVAGKACQDPVKDAQKWLSRNSGWLLILDNVDEDNAVDALQRSFFTAGMLGDVLITSRNPTTSARWDSIEVDDLQPHEAQTLLTNIVGPLKSSEDAGKVNLLKDLGHLALAVDQASYYIVATGITLQEYYENFQLRKRHLLEQYPSTSYKLDQREHLMTTWNLSFDQVGKLHPKAPQLLLMFSLLDKVDISLQMLKVTAAGQMQWGIIGGFEKLSEEECWMPKELKWVFKDSFSLLEAVSALRKFSMVRFQTGGTSLWIHPLVHFWASERLHVGPKGREELGKLAIGIISGVFVKKDLLPPVGVIFPPRQRNDN